MTLIIALLLLKLLDMGDSWASIFVVLVWIVHVAFHMEGPKSNGKD